MPARVVVLERAKPRPFPLLWAVPGWLRALWTALRTDEGEASPVGPRPASGEGAAIRLPGAAREPIARRETGQGVRCGSCSACVAACPSRCLSITGSPPVPGFEETFLSEAAGLPEAAGQGSARWLLLAWTRCIGCGRCVGACPEASLSLAAVSGARPAPVRPSETLRVLLPCAEGAS